MSKFRNMIQIEGTVHNIHMGGFYLDGVRCAYDGGKYPLWEGLDIFLVGKLLVDGVTNILYIQVEEITLDKSAVDVYNTFSIAK